MSDEPQPSPILFPVVERDAYYYTTNNERRPLSHIKVLVALDHKDEKPIAVVPRDHKLVLTYEVLSIVQTAIQAALPPPLPIYESMLIRDKVAYHGAMCIREYVFTTPHTKFIGGDGVLKLTACYEYNATRDQLQLLAGVMVDQDYQLVVGSYRRHIRRHADGTVHISNIGNAIERAVSSYVSALNRFHKLERRCYIPRDATSIINHLDINTHCKDHIIASLAAAAHTHGNTLWTLVTTIAKSFHDPLSGCVAVNAKKDNLEANRLRRAIQLSELLETDEWLRIEEGRNR